MQTMEMLSSANPNILFGPRAPEKIGAVVTRIFVRSQTDLVTAFSSGILQARGGKPTLTDPYSEAASKWKVKHKVNQDETTLESWVPDKDGYTKVVGRKFQPNKDKGKQLEPTPTCSFCERRGHTAEDCYSKHPSNKPISTNSPCFRCGERGHWARECTKGTKCYQCEGFGHVRGNCPSRVMPPATRANSTAIKGRNSVQGTKGKPTSKTKEATPRKCPGKGHTESGSVMSPCETCDEYWCQKKPDYSSAGRPIPGQQCINCGRNGHTAPDCRMTCPAIESHPRPTTTCGDCGKELTQDRSYHSCQALADRIAGKQSREPWDVDEIDVSMGSGQTVGDSDWNPEGQPSTETKKSW